MQARTEQGPTVFVIEDDGDVRDSLEGLFRSVGLSVALFDTVHSFAAKDVSGQAGCLVLDVRLPGKSGLDFYEDWVGQGANRPAVFISGHADIPMSVRAMKAGAIEFLTKPVRDQDLLDAVQTAIQIDGQRRERSRDTESIRIALATLTPRERGVLDHVMLGSRNKQIASDLGVSEATVKLYRGNVMAKMGAASIAELVRMVTKVEGDPVREIARPKV